MKNRRIITTIIGLIFGIFILWYILKDVNFSEIEVFKVEYLLLAIAMYILDLAVRGHRWKRILNVGKVDVSFSEAFQGYVLGNTLNIIIPAKIGDLARAYFLKKKRGYEYSKTLPSIVIDRVFDVIGVFIVISITGIYVLRKIVMPDWFRTLIILGVVMIVGFVVFSIILVRFKEKVNSMIKVKKITDFIDTFVDTITDLAKMKTVMVEMILYSILIWALDGTFSYIIFQAMDYDVNIMAVVFANMIATLTKVFPVTPGGVGVFEGTTLIVFRLFNYNSDIVALQATIDHLIMNLITIVFGIGVLFKENIQIKDIRQKEDGSNE